MNVHRYSAAAGVYAAPKVVSSTFCYLAVVVKKDCSLTDPRGTGP